jgi:hypothetical protein
MRFADSRSAKNQRPASAGRVKTPPGGRPNEALGEVRFVLWGAIIPPIAVPRCPARHPASRVNAAGHWQACSAKSNRVHLLGAQAAMFEPPMAANLVHRARCVRSGPARRYARIFAPLPHYAPASAMLHGDPRPA